MQYRKKPVVIEAVQWDGTNLDSILNFTFTQASISRKNFKTLTGSIIPGGSLIIETLEGEHVASVGDFIIRGVNGEFYPCKPDIFEKTYDIVTR